MGLVYRRFESERPRIITTLEQLHDGLILGGFVRERFMQGHARQAAMVVKDEVAAKKVQRDFRKHRAERRVERRVEGMSDDAFSR